MSVARCPRFRLSSKPAAAGMLGVVYRRNCLFSAASSNDFRAPGLSLTELVTPRVTQPRPRKAELMFLILAVVLVVLWLGGFTLFHVSGFLIHLLLIFAVISLIMHFIGGGRRTV
jgi:hypothetical protein